MPFPYVTNDALKQQVACVLQTTAANLPPQWDGTIAAANLSGAGDVRQQLIGKGFTIPQIESWDQLTAYVLDQGTFWALTRGGVGNDQVPEAKLKAFDRREELKATGFLTTGSTILYPAPNDSPVGGISHGHSEYREHLERQYDRHMGEPHTRRRDRFFDDTEVD
ncbi:MAG: hypothetical protein JWO38_2345 [Gemmataceae bacterium]|nr:hypothetical protein [Gemmataceae bacterium]